MVIIDKPIYVDFTGMVVDRNQNNIGIVMSDAIEVTTLIGNRLNLYDDLLRAVELLLPYAKDVPVIAMQDVSNTLARAHKIA